MKTKRDRQRLRRVYSALLALLLSMLMAGFSPALAHDELTSSNPGADQTLSQAPEKVSMTFSGKLMDLEDANQVRVTDSQGNELSQEKATVEGKQISQAMTGHGGEDETYTVTWRVVSEDGHPIQGSFSFSVGAGKTSEEVTQASAASSQASQVANQETEPAQAEKETSTVAKLLLFLTAAAGIVAVGVTVLLKRGSSSKK